MSIHPSGRDRIADVGSQILLQIIMIAALAVTALASPVYESQSYIQSDSGHVISQAPILSYTQEPVITYAQAPLTVAHSAVEAEDYVCRMKISSRKVKLISLSRILAAMLIMAQLVKKLPTLHNQRFIIVFTLVRHQSS